MPVERADVLADVAAEDERAHGLPELDGDAPAVLDGLVGDAAGRVEAEGLDDGVGRAGLDAQRAGAALLDRGRVGLERERRDDGREKVKGAVDGIDRAGVLADPADARSLGPGALENGPRVDVPAKGLTGKGVSDVGSRT